MRLPIPAPLRLWADAALSFLYPEVCQLCTVERATVQQGYVCARCREDVHSIQPPFCSKCGRPYDGAFTGEFICDQCRQTEPLFCWARSAAFARGTLLDAIHRYKYNRQLWFEVFLGELFANAAAGSLRAEPWDGLVPVPLFPVKQQEREFNQAERLARPIAAATGIKLESKLIRRVVLTQSQTRLSRLQRAENVRNAFALRSGRDVRGKTYVLIDDVLTTGATTNACAKVLLKGGAAKVAVWTLARGV